MVTIPATQAVATVNGSGNGHAINGLRTRVSQSAAVFAEAGQFTPVCHLLTNQGFDVDILRSQDLEQGSVPSRLYDLVLLDLDRFDDRWEDTCVRIRARHDHVPIVVLSEVSTVNERVRGFESGADEFITKPFSNHEMSARLRSLMRRSHTKNGQSRSGEGSLDLRYADLVMDLASRVAYRGETRIELSRREFSLLSFFVQNAEEVLSRDKILQNVWGTLRKHDSNVVDVYVNYLRNKTESGKHTRLIHTVRRQGYVLHHRPVS